MEHFSDRGMEKLVDRVLYSSAASRKDLGTRAVSCPDHGDYTSTGALLFGSREIWTGCHGCIERDRVQAKEAEERLAADRRRAELLSMIGRAAVPERFAGRTLDNFNASTPEQHVALEISKEFARNFEKHLRNGSGLVFSGMPGTGKSHLAISILQAIMPQHCGLYTTCMRLIRDVRGTWRRDSDRSESEVLRMFSTVPLLVLDEIGVQYGTDGEQTILFEVLDSRYQEMKPTILLTNQDKNGFKEYIGERSFDRLRESSRWVVFDWESYRTIARKSAT